MPTIIDCLIDSNIFDISGLESTMKKMRKNIVSSADIKAVASSMPGGRSPPP